MDTFNVLATLVTIAALFSWLNHRFIKLPHTTGLMVLSLSFSLAMVVFTKLSGVAAEPLRQLLVEVELDRTLLHGMLGAMLFAGALHLNINDLLGQKYIIGKHRMSIGQINQLLNEITGAPIPRLRIPGFLATITAAFCTLVANLTKKPPPWGMCSDQIRSMKESIVADGSKAETELGIEYTPVRIAIEEMVASFQV